MPRTVTVMTAALALLSAAPGGCCTDPARLAFTGTLQVKRDAGPSRVSFVRTEFANLVDLNGGSLEISELDPVFSDAKATRLQLEGGTLRSNANVRFKRGAHLVGPGRVVARTLRTAGPVRLAERGLLKVTGSLVLGPTADLTLTVGAKMRDRVVVSKLASLDGDLTLRAVRATRTRNLALVSADDRVGRFDATAGLAGRKLRYTAGGVRLRRGPGDRRGD